MATVDRRTDLTACDLGILDAGDPRTRRILLLEHFDLNLILDSPAQVAGGSKTLYWEQ